MKEVTLRIPDNKLAFFMELTKQLGLEAFVDNIEIEEAHKELVRSRIQMADENPKRLLVWEDVFLSLVPHPQPQTRQGPC